MTLETLQGLFEKIQDETSLKNLMEHKFNLSMETGKLHIKLHDGNSAEDRSNTIAVINAISTLVDILIDRIQEVKQKEAEARRQANIQRAKEDQQDRKAAKAYNIEEGKLAQACKRVLNRSTYKAILKVVQEMSHSEIKRLQQKDLPMLVLNVKDEE
jgi:hypothetical protein